jgi:hypothetical protein
LQSDALRADNDLRPPASVAEVFMIGVLRFLKIGMMQDMTE